MLYGYKGKLLHIDLTKEESKTIPLPEEILMKYLGGRGLGAKLYWDLIPPGTDPLAAQNVLMVLSGPSGAPLSPVRENMSLSPNLRLPGVGWTPIPAAA